MSESIREWAARLSEQAFSHGEPECDRVKAMTFKDWKAGFREAFRVAIGSDAEDPELDGIVEAEIDNWLDDDEWKDWKPADAASENMSYWDD